MAEAFAAPMGQNLPTQLSALVEGTAATLCGFALERVEPLPDIDGTGFVLRHVGSGARLLYLCNADENKAFCIGFKTPPADSTGVFHILEHSVLCGSAKFPVKEPFVDLIKSSMQTFLNAMTYPDKTVYPVASTNEQDLLNLMDVYMDAVLNPAIYTKPQIFQQEGWHYELDVPEGEDMTSANARLRYNGVVYNELKGALSDPMGVLDDELMAALFPTTCYSHESGGDPKHIPELTYAHFLNTHARHYNLENSYITLYGDMDVERVLAFLDERYLGEAAREHDAAARLAAAPAEAEVAAALAQGPNQIGHGEPLTCDYKRVEMVTTPDNALIGMGYVLGGAGALDRKRVLGSDVLFESLLGSNEAPVKRALLAAGVGGNVVSYTQDACAQPYEVVIVQGAAPEMAREARRVFEEECARLVREGIPRERLEAVLSSNEFDIRQRDYGMADGVALSCDALSTWLYSDDAATLALNYGPVFAELREELAGSYFEDLLREIVVEGAHRALVELVPVSAGEGAAGAAGEGAAAVAPASETAKLEAVRAAMTSAELQAVVDAEAELRRIQEAEDTAEARATLPRLRASDVGAPRREPALVVDTTGPLTYLYHEIPTHKLVYLTAYFDISHLAFQELPYVSVLAALMQQLATKRRSAAELDSYVTGNLGFLTFNTTVFPQPDWRLARLTLSVGAGALSEKLEQLASIPREVWAETLFEDTERIRDVLTQGKIAMEQTFLNAGHQAALSRAMSYVSPAHVANQQMGGVDYYRFVRDLLEHFDERAEALCDKLRELQARIFTSSGTYVSFTGVRKDFERFRDMAGDLGLCARKEPAKELMVPWPQDRREAFVIPSDVSFAARACDPRPLGIEGNGAWSVISQVLSYDYLWNEIRVKGGAYGCGFRAQLDRQMAFYTYRDPAIDASQERIDAAAAWLASFEPDDASFEGFIVSCAAGFDAPLKPYALAKRQDADFFGRRDSDWRERARAEVLATTPEQLRELAADVARVAEASPLCVFAGRDLIEASGLGLEVVDLLG